MNRPLRHLKVACGIAIALLAVANLPASASASHPYHVSNAEVSWNAKTKCFEVALCVWPADLEKAISRQQGEPVDIDKVDDLDQLLERYIKQKFVIRPVANKEVGAKPSNVELNKAQSANGQEATNRRPAPVAMRWVGHEKTLKTAWLYFELAGEEGVDWTIENRVFFELNEDQLNQIQLETGDSQTSMISSATAAQHTISTDVGLKVNVGSALKIGSALNVGSKSGLVK